MVTEICNCCGRSVAFGSGLYVNRIPDCDTAEDRTERGCAYPEGDFVCIECEDAYYAERHWEEFTERSQDMLNRLDEARKALNQKCDEQCKYCPLSLDDGLPDGFKVEKREDCIKMLIEDKLEFYEKIGFTPN